jgi:carbonic anhydrase
MEKLIAGIHKFQEKEHGRYQKLFHRLSREGQKPHTLFITCSDSRVLAELITQSQPGDLFVVKNVGNIVPWNGAGATNSTAAAIEFAIQSLEVSDVVICGHSHCGAMSALLEGVPDHNLMPNLDNWIEIAAPVRNLIENNYSHLKDASSKIAAAAEENVLFGLENLHTYPCVTEKLAKGELHLHGWFFKIETAEIFVYDPAAQQFQPIQTK